MAARLCLVACNLLFSSSFMLVSFVRDKVTGKESEKNRSFKIKDVKSPGLEATKEGDLAPRMEAGPPRRTPPRPSVERDRPPSGHK